jgi:hypothetical protein
MPTDSDVIWVMVLCGMPLLTNEAKPLPQVNASQQAPPPSR